MQALDTACGAKVDQAGARAVAEAAARHVSKLELAKQADKEETKWQVWAGAAGLISVGVWALALTSTPMNSTRCQLLPDEAECG